MLQRCCWVHQLRQNRIFRDTLTVLIAFLDRCVTISEYSRICFLSLVSIFYSWRSLVPLWLFLCPLFSFYFGGLLDWMVLTEEFNTIYSMPDTLMYYYTVLLRFREQESTYRRNSRQCQQRQQRDWGRLLKRCVCVFVCMCVCVC